VTRVRRFTYEKELWLLIFRPNPPRRRSASGSPLSIVDYFDGRLAIRYNGVELAYCTFAKRRQVDPFFTILRLYLPAGPAIDGSWKPGDLKKMN